MSIVPKWLYNVHTYRETFFTFGRAFSLVFEPYWLYKIPRLTLSAGALNTRGRKILSFSCNIDFCLGNGTRYAPAYYGSVKVHDQTHVSSSDLEGP